MTQVKTSVSQADEMEYQEAQEHQGGFFHQSKVKIISYHEA